jgi:hypothetical protein
LSRSASLVGRWAALGTCAVAALLVGAAPPVDETAGTELASSDGLSAETIYERVLDNRFRTFAQESRLVSADRAGRQQESRFSMKWRDFRDDSGDPTRGILSKTLVRYTHPFDLRHSGYLIQANHRRSYDQFVYYPSRRRVVRVNLRSEAIYGTDFSFEDVVPREAQDFEYSRLPDAHQEGLPVHVIDLVPVELADSEYTKIQVYVGRDYPVVLRARYWDESAVEVKEFLASAQAIREFDGVWVPMQSTMRNLRLESWTRLEVTSLEPNPEFPPDVFDLAQFEGR